MTIPYERYNSIINTEKFLLDLIDNKTTPRIPKAIRLRALSLLKHYPTKFDMDCVSETDQTVFSNSFLKGAL